MKRFLTLTLVVLGCFDPDLTEKQCRDDSGCPAGFLCAADKHCASAPSPSVDMGTDPRPKRVEVEVRPSGSFYVGTTFTDGINDTPSFLPKQNPAPFFLDEREVTVADYRACVTAQVCTAPKTGPHLARQGGSARTASRAKTSTRSPVSPRPSPKTSASGWAAGYRPKWSGNMRRSDSVARRPPISGWSSRSHARWQRLLEHQRHLSRRQLREDISWPDCQLQTCRAFTTCSATYGKRPRARFAPIPPRHVRPTSSRCAVPVGLTTTRAFPKQRRELGSLPKGYYPNQGFRCARNSKP
jgi:hypothetical protein